MKRNTCATSREDTSAGLALGFSRVAYVTLIDRGGGMINGRVFHIGFTTSDRRAGTHSDQVKGLRHWREDIAP